MNRSTRTALAAAAFAALFAGAAQASPEHRAAEFAAAQAAQTSMAAAVKVAEAHVPGGKAVEADFSHSHMGGWVYKVEVLSGQQKFEVRVDPATGKVITSRLDH